MNDVGKMKKTRKTCGFGRSVALFAMFAVILCAAILAVLFSTGYSLKNSQTAIPGGNGIVYAAEKIDTADIPEGTLQSVRVDENATNAYGVAGIYTSMGKQDLLDYGYIYVTVDGQEYRLGQDAEAKGFTVTLNNGGSIAPSSQNTLSVSYNGGSVQTNFSASSVIVNGISVIYEMDGGNNFIVGGETKYIYDNQNINVIADYITVYTKNNDGSVTGGAISYGGYSLSGNTTGSLLNAGSNLITVSYGGWSEQFTLNVVAVEVETLEAVYVSHGDPLPSYTVSPSSIKNYIKVKATYNNGTVDEDYKDYDIVGDLWAGAEKSDGKIELSVIDSVNKEVTSAPFEFEVTPSTPTVLSVFDNMEIISGGSYTSGSAFDLSVLGDGNVFVFVTFNGGQKNTHASYTDGRFGVIYCTDESGLEKTDDEVFDVAHKSIIITYRENGTVVESGPIPVKVSKRTVTQPNDISGSFTYSESADGTPKINEFTVYGYDYKTMSIVVMNDDGTSYVLMGSVGGTVNATTDDGATFPIDARCESDSMIIGLFEAGEYTVYARLIDKDNCQWSDDGNTDDIKIGQIIGEPGTYTFTSSLNKTTFTYGENIDEKSVIKLTFGEDTPKSIKDAYENGSLTYRYIYYKWNGSSYEVIKKPVEIGNYYVEVTIAEYQSFGSVKGEKLEFSITQVEEIINEFIVKDITYGDDGISLTVQTPFGEKVVSLDTLGELGLTSNITFEYTSGGEVVGKTEYVYNPETGEFTVKGGSEYYPTEAGDYTVKVTVDGCDNYKGGSASDDFTIKRKNLDSDPAFNGEPEYVYSQGGQSLTITGYDFEKMTFVFTAGGVTAEANTDANGDGAYYTVSGDCITLYFKNVLSDGYKITFTIGKNYAWADGSYADKTFEWRVTPKALTVSADESEFIYKGTEQTYNPDGYDGETMNISGNVRTNSGTHTVTVSLKDKTNYTLNGGTGDVTFDFVIKQAALTVEWGETSFTYNGSEQAPTYTVDGWFGSDETEGGYEITLSGAQKDAGKYTATLSVSGGDVNYYLTGGSVEFTIAKAKIDAPELSAPVGSVYNGTEQSYNLSGLDVNLSVKASANESGDEVTCDGRVVKATNAGSYTVTVYIADKKNYEWTGGGNDDITVTWNIAKAELTVTWGETSFTYDGNEQAPTYSVSGWKGNDGAMIGGEQSGNGTNYTLTLEGARKDAGDGTATLSLGGNEDNYTLKDTDESGTSAVSVGFTIAPKEITLAWVESDGWTTDGVISHTYTAAAQAPDVTTDDFAEADRGAKVTVAEQSKGTNVGTYDGLTFVISGANAGNYTLANAAELSYKITPAPLTVTWTNTDNLVYNGKEQAPTYSVSGWFGSDGAMIGVEQSGNGANYTLTLDGAQINAGNHTATLTLTASGTVNYYLEDSDESGATAVSVGFEIKKYVISLTELIASRNRLYEANSDGSAVTVTFSVDNFFGTPIKNIFTVDGNGTQSAANSDLTQPYTITLTLTDTVNYEWGGEYGISGTYEGADSISGNTATAVYWITALQYEFSVSFESGSIWTYGDEAHKIVLNVQDGVSVDTSSAQYLYYKTENGEQTLIGSEMPKDSGTYLVKVTLPTDGTYFTAVAEAAFTIEKRVATVTINVSNGTYGSWKNATVDKNIGNLAPSGYDQLTASNFTLSYYNGDESLSAAPTAAGTYKVFANLVGAANYTINETFVEFTIAKKAITAEIKDDSIEYGTADPTGDYTEAMLVFPDGSFVSGDTSELFRGFKFTTNYKQGDGVGTYYTYLAGYMNGAETADVTLDNYTVTVTRGTLTVTQKKIALTVDNSEVTYDGKTHEIGVTENGLYNGISAGVTVTYGGGYELDGTPVNAGEYTYEITIGNGNYVLDKSYKGTFTINKKAVAVSWDGSDRYTYNGEEQRDVIKATYTDVNDSEVQLATDAGEFKDYRDGGYLITASLKTALEQNNYELTNSTRTYYIDRASVTVTINNETATYGDGLPEFGANVTLCESETLDGIGFFATYAFGTNYAQGSGADSYDIYFTFGGERTERTINFGNYTFTVNEGTLTVGKRTVTLETDVNDGNSFEFNNTARKVTVTGVNELCGDDTFGDSGDIVIAYAYYAVNGAPLGTAPTNAGGYYVVISITSDNYMLGGECKINFTITPKALTVVWIDETFTYNGTDQTAGGAKAFATVSDSETSLDETVLTYTVSGKASEFRNAGEYTFTATLDNANYTLTNPTKVYVMAKRTVNSVTWDYEENHDFDYTGNDITASGDTRLAMFSGFRADGASEDYVLAYTSDGDTVNVGSFTVTLIIGDYGENYAFAAELDVDRVYNIVAAEFANVKAPESWEITYDGAEHDALNGNMPTAKGVDGKDGTFAYSLADGSSDGSGYVALGEFKKFKNVPDGTTVYYKLSLDNHVTQYGSFTVTILKAPLSISVDASVTYGNALPASENYKFAISEQAPTADTVVFTGTGFVGIENFDNLTYDEGSLADYFITEFTGRDAAQGVGDYDITLDGGFTSDNYEITYASGTVSVTAREITVTVIKATRHTYGENPVDLKDAEIINALTSASDTAFGQLVSDIISELLVYGKDGMPVTLAQNTAAGKYDIDGYTAGAYGANYIVKIVGGADKYVVEQRQVTLSVGETSKTYNGEEQSIKVSVTDSNTALSDELVINVVYSSDKYGRFEQKWTLQGEEYVPADGKCPVNADNYTVSISVTTTGGASGNYVATEATASFVINERTISIKIDNQKADYSGEEPAVAQNEWSYLEGSAQFVGTDAEQFRLVKAAGVNAGGYDITYEFGDGEGEFIESNYAITYSKGTFTINKIALVITAEDKSVTYGGEAPEYTVSYGGLVAKDNIGGAPAEGVLSKAVTAVSDYDLASLATRKVGDYRIYFADESITARNYEIEFAYGTLTVNKRPITITANKGESVYGDIPRVGEYTVTSGYEVTSGEIYFGDDLGIQLYINDDKYNAGGYDISYRATASEIAENYDITYEKGTFTVKKATLNVSAESVAVEYGATVTDDLFGYTLSGFKYEDKPETIGKTGEVRYTTGYTTTSPAGSVFGITMEGTFECANYEFTYLQDSGELTVMQRDIRDIVKFADPRFVEGYPTIYGMYSFAPSSDDARTNKTATVDIAALTAALEKLGITASVSNGGSGDIVFAYVYTTDETHTAYNGKRYDGTASGLSEGTDYMLDESGNVVPLYAGTYKVTLKMTSDNFMLSLPVTTDYRILKMRVTAPEWAESSFTASEGKVTNTLEYGSIYHARGDKSLTTNATYADGSATGPTGVETSVDTASKTITMTGEVAGKYSITLVLDDPDNYVWDNQTGQETDLEEITVSWSITQYQDVEIVITGGTAGGVTVNVENRDGQNWFTGYDWRYGGTAITITVTAQYNGGSETIDSAHVYFRYYSVSGGGELVSVPTNAGSYYVIAYVNGTAVYPDAQSERVYFTIGKAIVEKPQAGDSEFTYNGDLQTYRITDNENYIVTGNTATDAGNYTATVTLKDTNNYEWAESGNSDALEFPWQIAKKEINKPADPKSATYNGGKAVSSSLDSVGYDYDTMKIISVVGTNPDNAAGVSLGDGEYFVTAINADTYTVTVALRNQKNYVWNAEAGAVGDRITLTWTVKKYTVAAPTAGEATDITYNGETRYYDEYYADFGAAADDSLYTLAGTLTATNAGEYEFEAVLNDEDNYAWADGAVTTYKWKIAKASDNTVSEVAISGWTYGGEPNAPTASAVYGEVTYKYYTKSGDVYGEVSAPNNRTDAGTYYVKAFSAGTDNYNAAESEYKEFVITPFTVDVEWSAPEKFVYDGTDQSGKITATYRNVDGEPVTLSVSMDGGFTDAGSYEFTADGLASGNYVLSETSIARVYEIEKLAVTVKVTLGADSMPYGGTVPEISWACDGAEFISRDGVTVKVNASVTETSAAGVYAVTVNAEGNLSNYDVTYIGAELTVTARKITVTVKAAESVYGDNLATLTSANYSVTSGESDGLGIVNGDVNVITLYVDGASGNRTPVGSYDIKYVLNNANYDVTFVGAKYTVTAKQVSVVWSEPSAAELVYDGTDKSSLVSAYYIGVDGGKVVLGVSGGEMKNAGAYKFTAAAEEPDANYALADVEKTYTVTPKQITVTITDNEHVYGNVKTAIATSDGIIPEDLATTGLLLKYTGTAYNGTQYDGTVKSGWQEGREYILNSHGNVVPLYAGVYTIEVYAVVSGESENANYAVTAGYNGTFTVTKATVALPDAGSAFYNGKLQKADIPASDRYTVTENNGGTDAGTYRVELTLTDAYNYMWNGLTTETAQLPFVIRKAANSISEVTVSDSVYGDVLAPKATSAFGTVIYKYYKESGGVYTEIAMPSDVGTYYVRAEVSDSVNYDGCVSGYKKFSITKRLITKPEITEQTDEKDGSRTYIIEGYDRDYMVLKGIEVGMGVEIDGSRLIVTVTKESEHNLTVVLVDTDNCVWADGTEAPHTFELSVAEITDLTWLIILLAVVVFGELLTAIIRGVTGKKKNGGNGGDNGDGTDGKSGSDGSDEMKGLSAFLPMLTAAAVPGGQLAAIIALGSAAAAMGVVDVVMFVKKRKKKTDDQDSKEQETTVIDAKEAETTVSDTSEPETAVTDISEAETAVTDTTEPETIVSDTTEPETAVTDTSEPETAVTDISEAETAVTDTSEPETIVSDTSELETTVSDTSEPETAVTDITETETAVTDTTEPETAVTDITEPETTVADTSEAETTVPDTEDIILTAEEEPEDDELEDFTEDDDVEIVEGEEIPPEELEATTPLAEGEAVPPRRKILIRYKFSFRAKLIQAAEEVQARYGEFSDETLAYAKVKCAISWKQARIYSGRNTLAVVLFKGRKLCVAFALDPAEYAESKYGGLDVSEIKRFAKTPYLLKLTSARRLRYAKELFAIVAEKHGLIMDEVTRTEYRLPYQTTEELINKGLVKVLSSGDITDGAEVEKADISELIRERVTLSETDMLSDEVAAEYIETTEREMRRASRGSRAIINIDTLSQNFEADDLVTLEVLKEKKLVPPRSSALKVLARGQLDKPLTVEADDFSMDAVKMILLTGGRPVKLQ